jgi:hypothetical protein
MHELPRERKFSETDSQYCATLCTRTGAKPPFAPVEYPSSRHLDTPRIKIRSEASNRVGPGLSCASKCHPAHV